MAELGDEIKEVPIEYEYDPDYRMIAANGMYGGVTTRGDLRVDFFVEYQPTPEPGDIVYQTQPDGSAEEVRKSEKKRLVRRMQIGVLLPAQQVESFARWFQNKAEQIRELAEKEKKAKKKVH